MTTRSRGEKEELLYFNGVDGSTGGYGLPPMTGEQLFGRLRGLAAPENLPELKNRMAQQGAHYGVKEGVDPKKLDQAGWGIVFPHGADPGLLEALAPLIAHRKRQAGDRFRLYSGVDGLRPQESKSKFLARHGAGPGPADPARVPYYLLLVGDPEEIPYRFQSQLDVQYAVGRISFDRLEDYARYAESVVAAERGEGRRSRQLSLFGVRNPDDPATALSERGLVLPLADYLRKTRGDWKIDALSGTVAGKRELEQRLGSGGGRPALLFTAGHGMEFPNGDPRQLAHQGALLCGDWPGPKSGHGPIPQDFYLAADDLGGGADLLGLIGFFFACYGLGTPKLDDFAKQAFAAERAQIAPRSFLSALPQRMLSHPRGGALAVVGHVDRAWGYSFAWQGAGIQTAVFESTLDRLLDGHPIGSALEFFNERYAELSTVLADQLEEADYGASADPYELAGLWTASNDARGYLLLGDPAVRLALPPAAATSRGEPKGGLGLERGESRTVEIDDGLLSATREERSERSVNRENRRGERRELDESISYRAPPGPSLAPPARSPLDKGPALEQVQQGDDLRFSAYHPRALAVAEPKKVLVYAHLEAALRQIESDAAQRLGKEAQDFKRREAASGARVKEGTEILLVPQGPGLAFEPPEARLVWSPPWQSAEFEVEADATRAGHVVEASIGCYVGPLLIADIRVPIVVLAPGESAAPGEQQGEATVKPYQAIFASYSHADTALVKAMETAYQALGMDYLRDVMKLKAGQEWSNQLLAMIDAADIFQLFWSQSASESAYVEQEWRRALQLRSRKGETFIRPIYWQQPMPKVPRELSRVHFAPVEISPLGVLIPAAQEPRPAADEPKVVTIKTYAGDDSGDPFGGPPVAITRISTSGEIDNWEDRGIAAERLSLHRAAVQDAIAARLGRRS